MWIDGDRRRVENHFTGTGAASILTFENGTNAIISAKSFVFILFVVFKVNKKVCTAKLEPLKTTDKFSGDYFYTVLHKSDITNVNPPHEQRAFERINIFTRFYTFGSEPGSKAIAKGQIVIQGGC